MNPGTYGLMRPDLFGIRPFCEARRRGAIVSSLARQLPGMQELIVLGKGKRPEGREFRLHIQPAKVSAVLTQMTPYAGQDKA